MIERFNTLFKYENGLLLNRVSRGSARKDCLAGYITEDGYRRVRVDGEYFYVHRIVYELHHGKIKEGLFIDHIDGNRLNNNISNLRLATSEQNQFNKFSQKETTSQYKGVWFDKVKNVWKATFREKDKRIYLGQFNSEKEAAIAYDIKAWKRHGSFAKLNILKPEEINALL